MKYLLLVIVIVPQVIAQWEWVNPKFTNYNIRDIVALNESTFVACGDGGTIFRSSDYGETLEVTESVSGNNGAYRAIYFLNEKLGWAGGHGDDYQNGGKYIIKTTDGGSTWGRCYIGLFPNNSINDICFVNESTGWIAAWGLFAKTSNGGESWIILDRTNFASYDFVEFIDSLNGVVFVTGDEGRFMMFTHDGGETWDTTFANYDFANLINENIAYFGQSNGNLGYTDDGGENIYMLLNLGSMFTAMDFIDKTNGIFAVNKNDWSDYGTGTTTIWDNNWNSYDLEINGLTNSIDLVTKKYAYGAGPNGFLYKVLIDTGFTATQLSEGFIENIISIFEKNGIIWCLTAKENIYKYDTLINTWTKFYTPPLPGIKQLIILDTMIFASSSEGLLFIPQKGEIIVDSSFAEKNIGSIQIVNENIWMTGENGIIYRSDTTSFEWEEFVIPGFFDDDSLLNIDIVNDTLIYAVAKYNRFFKSTDAGTSWNEFGTIYTDQIRAIAFSDELHGTMVGDDGLVLHTENGGELWYNILITGSSNFNDIQFFDANYGCMIGNSGNDNLFQSTDAGKTWNLIPIYSTRSFNQILFHNDHIWLGGNKGVLIKNSIDVLTDNFIEAEKIFSSLIAQNYPNPFNPTTTIKFTLPTQGTNNTLYLYTKLIVYDILGREIKTLINKPMLPGNYEINFNGSNLSSGIYFYKLQSGKRQIVNKMILIK